MLVLGSLGTAQILQPGSAEALEGAPLNLTCEHSSINLADYIYWYRLFPNLGPQFIVFGSKGTVQVSSPEGALHISKDRKSSALALLAPGLGDAAVYYCAVSDTVRQAGAAPHKNAAWQGGASSGASGEEESGVFSGK
ncbi:hypothetical protein Y1Q_0010602 [Alligator mississippiensis]|uniref:Ig-like domain-containing protein n=1 Tax=Alligator mississippiensis TaxID=8496 RepID=A0A151PGU5_ALLMI|nr:hypothetical protein Y1Q_0010602 [Alligator mississippiensis]